MKKKISRGFWLRTLMYVIATGIIFYFLPRSADRKYIYEPNRPWTYADLMAPFDIPVQRDSLSIAQMRDSINAAFVPIYKKSEAPRAELLEAISQSTVINPAVKFRLAAVIERIYQDGVIDQDSWARIQAGTLPQVRSIDNSEARSWSTDAYRSPREAYKEIDAAFPDPMTKRSIQQAHIGQMLNPNIIPDTAESNRLRDEKLRMATAPIGVIQQGERIIAKGDIVTPQQYSVLRSYESMLEANNTRDRSAQYIQWLGQLLYIIVLLGSLYGYMGLYRDDLYHNLRSMVCILTLIVGFFVAASLCVKVFAGSMYIVPFAIMPIVMCVFFDSRTATFAYTVAILLCAPITATPFEFIIVQFAEGMTAIYSIKEFSRRSQLIRTALFAFIAAAVAYCAFELMVNGGYESISPRVIGYLGINAVLISFAYMFIFILEKVFGFVSVVTLVELSDINNPILRELSEECPGTFQHSMAVSNLATDAAHRVGANVQLTRTGALYHDIGKINNPAFFTENQHGVNPHSALDPIQSAKIVINHVNDGLKRADGAKLPKVVRDFISQHHGRGKARYFYTTYRNAHPDEDVDPAPFTYPGPNPQSVEASILMMADSVEAASRSLKEYTDEAITELVNRIIDSQIAEGLHNESPISFRDIAKIKEAFKSRLRTMYHARVSYPTPR